MNMKGIDLSHWNGTVDFAKVKKAGYKFAILKAGGSDSGYYKDTFFERNYSAAKKAGLYVGAYFFCGANFYKYPNKEASYFKKLLKGKEFEMPVYFDIESSPARTKALNTSACKTMCSLMEDDDYFVGIYGSDLNTFRSMLTYESLTSYAMWVARYGKEPSHTYGIWQKSATGNVSGVNGHVDLDLSTNDYPKTIKKKGFNGFTKQE